NACELKLVLSASMLAAVAKGSAGFIGPGPVPLSPHALARATIPAMAKGRGSRRELRGCAMGPPGGESHEGERVAQWNGRAAPAQDGNPALRDHPAPEQPPVRVVQRPRLPRRDGAHRLG